MENEVCVFHAVNAEVEFIVPTFITRLSTLYAELSR